MIQMQFKCVCRPTRRWDTSQRNWPPRLPAKWMTELLSKLRFPELCGIRFMLPSRSSSDNNLLVKAVKAQLYPPSAPALAARLKATGAGTEGREFLTGVGAHHHLRHRLHLLLHLLLWLPSC